jgi:hypothetical protein
MSTLLRKIFGPNKEEIWQQLCHEIGAEYINNGIWKGDKVVAKVKEWTITLDTYTVSTGKSHVTYTRMRAPYVNADGFRFKIYRKSVFSNIGKYFGMKDIEVGYPEFDRDFIIKASDESKTRSLFMNDRIRALIHEQPSISLEVKDDEGWFGKNFPEGVDELYFQVTGVITDVKRLKSLYDLFGETLNHLCHIGSAYENDPQIKL